MPIYEYKCKDCEKVFEALRLMKEADLPINCTHCSSSTPYRIQSACYSSATGSSHSSSSHSCGGCQGGSCSSCSH